MEANVRHEVGGMGGVAEIHISTGSYIFHQLGGIRPIVGAGQPELAFRQHHEDWHGAQA